MNTIRAIRTRLGLTQSALAASLGCTQGNVGHYERGQQMPPGMAKRLIQLAAGRGVVVGYEDVYGPAVDPADQASPMSSTVAGEAEGSQAGGA